MVGLPHPWVVSPQVSRCPEEAKVRLRILVSIILFQWFNYINIRHEWYWIGTSA